VRSERYSAIYEEDGCDLDAGGLYRNTSTLGYFRAYDSSQNTNIGLFTVILSGLHGVRKRVAYHIAK
jgi:hypothetical protein